MLELTVKCDVVAQDLDSKRAKFNVGADAVKRPHPSGDPKQPPVLDAQVVLMHLSDDQAAQLEAGKTYVITVTEAE